MFCCHQLHKLIQLFWIKELGHHLSGVSSSFLLFPPCDSTKPGSELLLFPPLAAYSSGCSLAAKWHFIQVLGEGRRKCSGETQNAARWAVAPKAGCGLPVGYRAWHGNFRYMQEGTRWAWGGQIASQELEQFFVSFASVTRKTSLWKDLERSD